MHPVLITYKALVEAIVPDTPMLALFGPEQVAGAVELFIYEYIIWELDHYISLYSGYYLSPIPLSSSTAMLLDAGAVQLVAMGLAPEPPKYSADGGTFAHLSPVDRIRTMSLLENGNVDPGYLPEPYRYNLGFVAFMVDFLNRQTMFGYYSEWSGYGSTRLASPSERRLEFFPLSWIQAGYPGVSLGYRDFRGFMLRIDRQGGSPSIVQC